MLVSINGDWQPKPIFCVYYYICMYCCVIDHFVVRVLDLKNSFFSVKKAITYVLMMFFKCSTKMTTKSLCVYIYIFSKSHKFKDL